MNSIKLCSYTLDRGQMRESNFENDFLINRRKLTAVNKTGSI